MAEEKPRGFGLNVGKIPLQSEDEIIAATPRRPAGEFRAVKMMQANLDQEAERPKSSSTPKRHGRLMSSAESQQKRMKDNETKDVQEEEDYDDEYGEDEFDDDFDDDDFDDNHALSTETNSLSAKQDVKLKFRASKLPPTSQTSLPKPISKSNEWLVERVYVHKKQLHREEREELARQAERVENIFKDVELTSETFEIFRRDPVPKYNLYVRAQARGKIRENACQYNDDWRSIKVQTEQLRMHSIATQFPDFTGSAITDSDIARLPDFVFRAARVIETLLLEQNRSKGFWGKPKAASLSVKEADGKPLTSENIKLTLPKPLCNRRLRCINFSPADPNLLLCAYSPELVRDSKGDIKIETSAETACSPPSRGVQTVDVEIWEKRVMPMKSLLCAWHLHQPESPASVMYCDGNITCCGMSERGNIVYAGSQEGSILLWDLREKPILHRKGFSPGLENYVLRHPSFSTDHQVGKNHFYPIRKVILLPSGPSRMGKNGLHIGIESSFQLASMDEAGNISVWTAVELQKGNIAGSESDFGLHIGARIKLIKASDVVTNQELRHQFATDLQCNPKDPGELLLALSSGVVHRVRRFGDTPAPRLYFMLEENAFFEELESGGDTKAWGFDWELSLDRASDNEFKTPMTRLMTVEGALKTRKKLDAPTNLLPPPPCARKDSCTSICFSPFQNEYFLSAYRNGQVCLFATSLPQPIKSWNAFASTSLLFVRWSQFRPSVFFVLDAGGTLHTFDLLENTTKPQYSGELPGAVRRSSATAMLEISSNPGKLQKTITRPTFAYCDQNTSTVTVFAVTSKYTLPAQGEKDIFAAQLARWG